MCECDREGEGGETNPTLQRPGSDSLNPRGHYDGWENICSLAIDTFAQSGDRECFAFISYAQYWVLGGYTHSFGREIITHAILEPIRHN